MSLKLRLFIGLKKKTPTPLSEHLYSQRDKHILALGKKRVPKLPKLTLLENSSSVLNVHLNEQNEPALMKSLNQRFGTFCAPSFILSSLLFTVHNEQYAVFVNLSIYSEFILGRIPY